MDAIRWRALSTWLDQLLELEPALRQPHLQALAEQDPELAEELQRLLAQEEESQQFMAQPLWNASPVTREDTQVGPYRLHRLLGEGGMGEVWLAQRCDGLYDRQVALKLLRSGLADPGLQLRFARERQILARLRHPNLAQLLDAGIDPQGHPYFALDYVQGEPITDHCLRLRLPLQQRLQLMLQVCAVVSHAHVNLVVHRDLKPSNILVADDGTVKLLDFGIAQLLEPPSEGSSALSEARAFTLHYAAPEQVRGEPVTTLVDVYALGVVLYELLTDCKPYHLRRQSDRQWERAVLEAEVPLASHRLLRDLPADGTVARARRRRARQLRGDLDQVLATAMHKQPAQRYGSVDALAEDLRRVLQQRPLQARSHLLGYRFIRYLQRHRWTVLAASLAGAALLGASAMTLWQGHQARQEVARRQAMQDFTVGLFDRAASVRHGRFDVRALLATGLQRGEIELADQPVALAELEGVIGRLRIGLGDYQAALATLDAQQMRLRGRDDVPAELLLDAAGQRARALRMLGRDGDCVAQLLPLRDVARQQETRLPVQVAELYSQLGRCQAQLGELGQARQAFRQALALRRGTVAGPLLVAESLADEAMLEALSGQLDAAQSGYQHALALLDAAHSGQTAQAITLRRHAGVLLARRGHPAAAARMLEQAWQDAVQAFGAGHPESLVVRRERALLAMQAGQWAWAGDELQQVRRAQVPVLGSNHRELGHTEHALGDWARARGQPLAAIEHYTRAARIWSAPDHLALLPQALIDLGAAERDAGRPAQARQRWARAAQLLAAQRGAQAPQVQALRRQMAALPAQAEQTVGVSARN